jgi:hypothetical protein
MPRRSEFLMKLKRYVVALLMASSLTPLAMAQSGMNLPSTEQYVPRLGDIMNAIQQRHMKLWFAGKARNWELAAYELRQLKSGLIEAATLYSGIPATNVTRLAEPARSASSLTDATPAISRSDAASLSCRCLRRRPSVIRCFRLRASHRLARGTSVSRG